MRHINHIVIHHSASPLSTTIADINEWHRSRGWSGVGYHFVCESSGEMKLSRSIGKVGAHVKGSNRNSIGICLVGDNTQPEQRWREIQIETLKNWISVLTVIFPEAHVCGHRDMPNATTECPGLDVRPLLNLNV